MKFCLNNCGEFGTCKSGICECDKNYYGEDCTIYIYNVGELIVEETSNVTTAR